jgi:hypothetical protein
MRLPVLRDTIPYPFLGLEASRCEDLRSSRRGWFSPGWLAESFR